MPTYVRPGAPKPKTTTPTSLGQVWRPTPKDTADLTSAPGQAMSLSESLPKGRWNLSRPLTAPKPKPAPSITPTFGPATQSSGSLSEAVGQQAVAPMDYDAAFRNALESSRSGVTKQFELALGDIAQREAAAGQGLSMLPGQVTDIYSRGDANVGQGVASLDAAQQASGLSSFMGAGDQLAPLQAAMQGDLAARQADVPLLQMAMQADANRQRGALQNARLDAMSGIDSQLSNYYLQGADRQASQSFQRERDLVDAEQALYLRELDEQKAMRLKDYDAQLKQGTNSSSGQIDRDTGMTYGQMDAVRQTPAYKVALSYLSGNYAPQDSNKQRALLPEEAYAMYAGNPQLLKVLATDNMGLSAYIGDILAGNR